MSTSLPATELLNVWTKKGKGGVSIPTHTSVLSHSTFYSNSAPSVRLETGLVTFTWSSPSFFIQATRKSDLISKVDGSLFTKTHVDTPVSLVLPVWFSKLGTGKSEEFCWSFYRHFWFPQKQCLPCTSWPSLCKLLGSRPKEQEDRDLTRLQLSLANHGAIFLGFGPLSVKEHDMKSCHDFSDASVSLLILWFWPVCHLA